MRASQPRLQRLRQPPLVLVAARLDHRAAPGSRAERAVLQHCSIGCYSSVLALCRCLQRHLLRHAAAPPPAARRLRYLCYRWSARARAWVGAPIDTAGNQVAAMCRSLGCRDMWETQLAKRRHSIHLTELHSVHPHTADYLLAHLAEGPARAAEQGSTSHTRCREWKQAKLLECIVHKPLQVDHAPTHLDFPTAVTPLQLCADPAVAQIASSCLEHTRAPPGSPRT